MKWGENAIKSWKNIWIIENSFRTLLAERSMNVPQRVEKLPIEIEMKEHGHTLDDMGLRNSSLKYGHNTRKKEFTATY